MALSMEGKTRSRRNKSKVENRLTSSYKDSDDAGKILMETTDDSSDMRSSQEQFGTEADTKFEERQEVASRTLNNERINRSLGLLNQATGLKGVSSTPVSASKQTERQSRQQHMTSMDTYTPLRKQLASRLESSQFTPNRTLLTPASMLTTSLFETSHHMTRKSILSTPAGVLGVSVLEPQSAIPLDMEDATFTNMNLLLQEDPGISATEGLYEDFLTSFKTHQSPVEVFTLISKYEQICSEQWSLLHKLVRRSIPGQQKFQRTLEVLKLLEHEKNTWRLFGSLFQDRQMEEDIMDDEGIDAITQSKGKSEKEIIDSFFERDSCVRQNQMVVDWLEQCAADQQALLEDKVEYYSENLCWENTLHNLQQKGSGAPVPSTRSLVTSLDPDAPIRQNKNLADLDKEDEVRLLKDIFCHIRSGQLEKAQILCKKCGQPWRAATLEGWRLYNDPNVRAGSNLLPLEGNSFRDVWKSVCWRMSEDERFHLFERAMYAALSGNLRELLPACDSWLDYLWAFFRVMVDLQVEQELRDKLITDRNLDPLPSSYYHKDLNPINIFQELQANPNQKVELQSKERHHVIQKYIILNDVDALLEEMSTWLNDQQTRPSHHMVRFMAHMVLSLNALGLQTREDIFTHILEVYVQDLIEEKRSELVATYVSQLPSGLQIMWYARFLEGIQEKEERQRCLHLAEEAGLDVASITKTVVENIRLRSNESYPIDVAHSQSLEAATSDEDRVKIAAIDWLVFDPSQRAEAMKQSNGLIRTFLATKKHEAAREVFQKIPQDSIDVIYRNWKSVAGRETLPADDENAIREYLCIRTYLDALDAFNLWFEHFHNKRPTKPQLGSNTNFHGRVRYEHEVKEYEMEMNKWERTLTLHTKDVSDKVYNILLFVNGGWMVDQRMDGEEDESRMSQMERLRELCIPMVCTLLLTVLHKCDLYKGCVALADIIASENYQLYRVFSRSELKQLLSKIRESSLCLLDEKFDALGYEIAS